MRIKVLNNQERERAFNDLRKKSIKRATYIEQKEIRRKRSLDQNAGFWVWMTFLQEQTGSTKQDLHDYFLDLYPIFKEVIINNEIKLVRIGTSKADTKQMSILMNYVDMHSSSEWGIILPELGGKKLLDMYNHYREERLL